MESNPLRRGIFWIIGAAVVSSLGTAYLMREWTGAILTLAVLAVAAFVVSWLWKRGQKLRQIMGNMVRVPLQVAGDNKKMLAVVGAGTISLVGLYALLGGDSAARAQVEAVLPELNPSAELPDHIVLSQEQYEQLTAEFPALTAAENSGIPDLEWAAAGGASASAVVEGPGVETDDASHGGEWDRSGEEELSLIDEGEAARAVGTYGMVVPVIALVHGVRSLFKQSREVREGEITRSQALRRVGVDVIGSAGRAALFVGGAKMAGILVGGVPVVIASGILANMAGEPFLRRFQAWLTGDSGRLAQENVQVRLEQLGRSFDERRLLEPALANLTNFVDDANQRQGQAEPPSFSWQEQFFPTWGGVLEGETYRARRAAQEQLEEFSRKLEVQLRDNLIRRDYAALGELIFFNRECLLTGLERELQRPLSQLDKALRRLEQDSGQLTPLPAGRGYR